jgi:thiol-disulfide isomerase/thioredoxin
VEGEKVTLSSELGFIDKKYFSKDSIILKVNNEFTSKIKRQDLDYPHAFRFLREKEEGKYPFGKGFVFVEKSTTEIKIDTLFQFCPKFQYDDLNQEYRYKFLPFVYNRKVSECTNIIESLFFNREEDDQMLLKYIVENPDSWVALWHLIERVTDLGYTATRESAMRSFSAEMQEAAIWKTLNTDLLRLKQYAKGQILPSMSLKSISLENLSLNFNTLDNKFTLVEFWFSRCIPCHKNFEKLIPLHESYKNAGFNIINVSTDPKQDIEMWKQHLKAYNFQWDNYLDIGGLEASKMNITSYPHSFLLDRNGQIVMVDPKIDDLEFFLEQNL